MEITTLDIAKFFYSEKIDIYERIGIIYDLWQNKKRYLEYYLYGNLKTFSGEINNLLMDFIFGNIILYEVEDIISIQKGLEANYKGYGLYKINKNKTEDFLKHCKLRIMYGSDRDYIYMKMKTLVKGCGYKRRTKHMLEELDIKLLKLELYIENPNKQIVEDIKSNFKNIKIDEFIKIHG